MRYGGVTIGMKWILSEELLGMEGCSRCDKGVEIVEHVVYGYGLGRLLQCLDVLFLGLVVFAQKQQD